MKLIEIRFANLSHRQWEDVATSCSRLFQELGEFDLSAISVSGPGRSEADIRNITIDEIAELLAISFRASQQTVNRNFADIITIKSNRSRRFIVTEEDGVIRICLAIDDPVPDFSSVGADTKDASHLLITTDLFDYI